MRETPRNKLSRYVRETGTASRRQLSVLSSVSTRIVADSKAILVERLLAFIF